MNTEVISMDEKLARAIEFIKLLRWKYPLPSKLKEIDKFIFECEKEAAKQSAQNDEACPECNGEKVKMYPLGTVLTCGSCNGTGKRQ